MGGFDHGSLRDIDDHDHAETAQLAALDILASANPNDSERGWPPGHKSKASLRAGSNGRWVG
jgi:hypothetical protein